MAERRRDYAREYQRRNELARQRGFRSYGQQRHYTEVTGERAKDVVSISPERIAETYHPQGYDYQEYLNQGGDDRILDSWIKRSEARGVDPEEAFQTYMRRSKGGKLNRNQVRRLARDIYNRDWDEQWETS